MSYSVARFSAAAFAAGLTFSSFAQAQTPEPTSNATGDVSTPAPAPVAAPAPAAVTPVAAREEGDEPLTRREYRRLPKRLAYSEGDPVPAHYVVQTSARRGLLVGGIATIGAPWAVGIITGAISGFSNQGGWLGIPVAGPWLTYGLRKDCFTSDCFATHKAANNSLKNILLLDGGVQAVGLGLLITGIVLTKTELVRDDLAKVWVVPSNIGQSGYGLTAIGRF